MRGSRLLCCLATAILASGSWAQTSAPPAPQVACPAVSGLTPLHLYGLWRADFEGLRQSATLLFEKHPDHAESVRGSIQRAGAKALCVGDVDDGVFTLEESGDGHNITASWTGTVVDGSCGKEISGTWKNTSDPTTEHPFVLRKQPGWR